MMMMLLEHSCWTELDDASAMLAELVVDQIEREPSLNNYAELAVRYCRVVRAVRSARAAGSPDASPSVGPRRQLLRFVPEPLHDAVDDWMQTHLKAAFWMARTLRGLN